MISDLLVYYNAINFHVLDHPCIPRVEKMNTFQSAGTLLRIVKPMFIREIGLYFSSMLHLYPVLELG